MNKLVGFGAAMMLCAGTALAQKMDVKIVARRTSDSTYSYQIAGYAESNSTSNCSGTATGNGYSNTADVDLKCSSNGTTTYTAPRQVSYSVTGATLSLLLPDGRLAVVNCVGKLTFGIPVTVPHHRSCRLPLVNDISAEFKGKSAKLSWVVSVDGKKFDSETYQILAVLPKQ